MERVLIVAKTRMSDGVCVSGLTRNDNRSIRLIPPGRNNQPVDTEFDVGQVWDVHFRPRPSAPPHVEDVIVENKRYITKIQNMRETLLQHIKPWYGEPNILFDGLLVFDNTKGYISQSKGIPTCSTGYWMPSKDLILDVMDEKPHYRMKNAVDEGGKFLYETLLSIPYVGCAETVGAIPANTLVRVSLARWWKPRDSNSEPRCYLQLSGWYS